MIELYEPFHQGSPSPIHAEREWEGLARREPWEQEITKIKLIFNDFFFSQSRAALSLLGYCYFQVQSFDAAADW